jgi:hypothetical protein
MNAFAVRTIAEFFRPRRSEPTAPKQPAVAREGAARRVLSGPVLPLPPFAGPWGQIR